MPNPKIEIGDKFTLIDANNPFRETSVIPWVTIIDVKKGWVKYGFYGYSFPVWTKKISNFLSLYELTRRPKNAKSEKKISG